MIIFLIVAAWIACGLLTWGTAVDWSARHYPEQAYESEYAREYPSLYAKDGADTVRAEVAASRASDYRLFGVMAALGPIGLVAQVVALGWPKGFRWTFGARP